MGTGVRLPRAERRAQIIDTAGRAFLAGGFDGTSMEDVARAAGVTRLIVYRIFESKEDLYRAVLDEVMNDLADAFKEDSDEMRRSGGFSTVLLGIGRRHPAGFRLLWRHAAHEPAFNEYAELFRTFAVDYSETVIAVDIADPTMLRWAARSILGYLFDGICSWLDDGDPERDDEFVQILAAGSRALVASWSETAG